MHDSRHRESVQMVFLPKEFGAQKISQRGKQIQMGKAEARKHEQESETSKTNNTLGNKAGALDTQRS